MFWNSSRGKGETGRCMKAHTDSPQKVALTSSCSTLSTRHHSESLTRKEGRLMIKNNPKRPCPNGTCLLHALNELTTHCGGCLPQSGTGLFIECMSISSSFRSCLPILSHKVNNVIFNCSLLKTEEKTEKFVSAPWWALEIQLLLQSVF